MPKNTFLERLSASFRALSGQSGHPRDPVIAEWFGSGSETASGINVTADSALKTTAVYACVRVLAEAVSSMPLVVYRRLDGGGKERDPQHPLYQLLHDKPNGRQTSFEWRETQMAHLALRGNAYARIITRNDGTVESLIPLHPDRVMPFEAPNGRLAFAYSNPKGGTDVYLNEEILFIPGLSFDGLKGLSPIATHRETVGFTIAAQEYGARFFGNNAAPKGAIKIPASLSDKAATALRESWERRHKGVENAHKLAILDGGMEWAALGLSNEDAQYLETRKFQVADIARIFRVPPHKIGDLDRATFSNIEHQAIEFVTDTVMPWVVRWEQRLNNTLLTEAGRRTHYIGFVVDGLLRGDIKSRYDAYAVGRQWGWLSTNDIRAKEDMNLVSGGDTYLVPLNMAPADKAMDVLLRDTQKKTEQTGDDG